MSKIPRNFILKIMIGWKAFNESLKSNKTMHESPVPQRDIKGCISITYSRDRSHNIQNSIAKLMSEIQDQLKNNKPKLTSVKSVGICCESNSNFNDDYEVTF